MKTHRIAMAALFILGACSTSPGSGNSGGSTNLGGGSNSENGKAFITALKGKLFADSGFNTEMVVADTGDITVGGATMRFAGAPSKTTAYFYIAKQLHDGLGLPDKTMVEGYLIDGNGVYKAGLKKSDDEIAVEMGFANANATQNGTTAQKAEFNKRVASPENVDFSVKGNQAGYIKP